MAAAAAMGRGGGFGGSPVLVVQSPAKREKGNRAQLSNIAAGRTIADVVRTTLGPRAMLKMMLDPMGGIVLTNDGNAILREVDVAHPVARTLLELSRAQDEEVGDGTTSVVILAGELLAVAEPLLTERRLHPTQVVRGYMRALAMAGEELERLATPVDMSDENSPKLLDTLAACLGTKFSGRWGELLPRLALRAVLAVAESRGPGARPSIDVKRFAKVEKVPGGEPEDSAVLDGVMLNKDVTHPKMRRRIEDPKVLLIDSPLEYKKGESQTAVEITKEEDWEKLLRQEEAEVERMCRDIIASGCNLVVTEKGVSDLAQHFLVKAGVSVIRRIRKSDSSRLARVTGAVVVNRTDEIAAADVGTRCKLFEVRKLGDEYFAYFTKCEQPAKACTILLRGGSKDVLNEVERNLHDALGVARNLALDAKLLPGAGATEMALAAALRARAAAAAADAPLLQHPIRAVADALEVIPRTLAVNSGADVVRVMTALRAVHAKAAAAAAAAAAVAAGGAAGGASADSTGASTADSTGASSPAAASGGVGGAGAGIDGRSGEITDAASASIWDSFAVKQQTLKGAIEAAAMVIRIDDILSAGGGGEKDKGAAPPQEDA